MSTSLKKYVPPLPELALVALVGFGLTQASRRARPLASSPILTGTLLYTLGFVVARGMK